MKINTRTNNNTIEGIDLLRGIAIILMIITHATRLLLTKINKSDLSVIYNFFLNIEPFTSSLFLFLAGIGIYYSNKFTKLNHKEWLLSNFKKAIVLYIIGVVFFITEYQVITMDTFLSPSILSVIALAICSNMIIIRSSLWLKSASLVLILAIYHLFSQESISGFNAGPGGAFPLIGFTTLGIISAELKEKNIKALLSMILLSSIFWFISEPFTQSFVSNYGDLRVSFWNHSLAGFLKLIPLLSASFIFCFNLKNYFLSTLGRNSLFCYIFHLVILAILFKLEIIPKSTEQLTGLILLLIASCYVIKKS